MLNHPHSEPQTSPRNQMNVSLLFTQLILEFQVIPTHYLSRQAHCPLHIPVKEKHLEETHDPSRSGFGLCFSIGRLRI